MNDAVHGSNYINWFHLCTEVDDYHKAIHFIVLFVMISMGTFTNLVYMNFGLLKAESSKKMISDAVAILTVTIPQQVVTINTKNKIIVGRFYNISNSKRLPSIDHLLSRINIHQVDGTSDTSSVSFNFSIQYCINLTCL